MSKEIWCDSLHLKITSPTSQSWEETRKRIGSRHFLTGLTRVASRKALHEKGVINTNSCSFKKYILGLISDQQLLQYRGIEVAEGGERAAV